jgi:hypothetical protein
MSRWQRGALKLIRRKISSARMKEPVEVELKITSDGYFTTSDSETATDTLSAADPDDQATGATHAAIGAESKTGD